MLALTMNDAVARTGLPLVPYLKEISATLASRRALVLTAEPGSGKSTLVPPSLLDSPWLAGGKIVMLEPRRLAAAAIALRISELLGEPLGRRAGYRVRSASRVGPETRIEVVTEALLTRAIQADPLLQGVGLVIFDEFHERSIHADLSLSLALEVKRARPELAVLVMSATLDTAPISALLDGAPVLSCPGRLYPVSVSYSPPSGRGRGGQPGRGGVPPFQGEEISRVVVRAFDDFTGDILVFLPGVGEISRVRGLLEGTLGGRADILSLHGSLPLEEQRRVIAPGPEDSPADARPSLRARGGERSGGAGSPGSAAPRRIILSTSIAETSLTVPGIRVVVDSGWARISRFHPATGMDRLVTERVSAASAAQRTGRAGRTAPGSCIRAWEESEHLLPALEPEILRADLSGLALECAVWGARGPEDLRWLDAPPRSSWSAAEETLRMLKLLDDSGVTEEGRVVAALGLPPRLGVLARSGTRTEAPASLAAACAAVLSERDGSEVGDDPDIRLRLEILRTGRGGRDSWRAAMEREERRILRKMGGAEESRPGGRAPSSWTGAQEAGIGGILARAFPDRIARREPDGSYRLVTGRAAVLPSRGPGAARVQVSSRAAADWIVAPDTDAGETVGVIRLAAPLSAEDAERALAPLIEERREVRWQGLVPKAFRVRRAERLVLSEKPEKPDTEAASSSFMKMLGEKGTAILPWDSASRAMLARIRFYAAHAGARSSGPAHGGGSTQGCGQLQGPVPDSLTEEGLVREADRWLLPYLEFSGGPAIGPKALLRALSGTLGPARRDFEKNAPESIELPTGGRRRIEYGGHAPAVEARIQEVFGLKESPRVCGVPLTFRLLSPAHRPLQITTDLASFWKSGYAEVRREMRGRYPKHYWPEDPTKAEAITGVRPKKRKG